MRRRQTARGQVLVLILLVLIGLVLIFGVISLFAAQNREAPQVSEAFWTRRDQQVTVVTLGDGVKAHVVVQASEEYVGAIVVKVKKDVRLWFDSDYAISTLPVNLKGGEQRELTVEFIPDEASAGSLRGYLIEVDFKVTRTGWTMENAYPPRLTVQQLKD